MKDPDDYPTHLDVRSGDPRGRTEAQHDIHRAVRLLQEQHDVSESAAFLMLVRASAESDCSVRETSSRLIAAHQGGS